MIFLCRLRILRLVAFAMLACAVAAFQLQLAMQESLDNNKVLLGDPG
jgi:hypothetical protein